MEPMYLAGQQGLHLLEPRLGFAAQRQPQPLLPAHQLQIPQLWLP